MLFISGSSAETEEEKFDKLAVTCKAGLASSVTLPTFEQMISEQWQTEDPVVKCFIHCIGMGFGEVSAEGVLVLDALKKSNWTDEATAEAAYLKCKDKGTDLKDKCDRSYQQYECFFDEIDDDSDDDE